LTRSDSAVDFLGFRVSRFEVEEIVHFGLKSDNLIINCFNAHSYAVSKKNVEFKDALERSDVLLPDGSGVALLSSFVSNVKLKKISGHDLFGETLSQLNVISGTVFLLGSSPEVLNKMVERARVEFPNVKVGFLSPPFKAEFSAADLDSFVEAIQSAGSDVVFVGMTAPKQEIIINRLSRFEGTKFLAGIGAVFDFYAGTIQRPRKIWITLHLEWAGRFLQQPRHLWRRVFISMPVFVWDVILFGCDRFFKNKI